MRQQTIVAAMKAASSKRLLWLGLAALVAAAIFWARAASNSGDSAGLPALAPKDAPALGLMTSLPIYWNEGDAFAALGSEEHELPWVRRAIEQRYRISPLDSLSAAQELSGETSDPLQSIDHLAIIQPRGLSPSDNVALDDWVRGGGKLLLVLDPMLVGEYEVMLGDPRHPTVSAVIPPVVERWGYRITFDDAQSDKARLVTWDGLELPVVLAGAFVHAEPPDGVTLRKPQSLFADRALAHFPWGEGQVTILADAALFEPREGNDTAEATILALFSKAFS